ncbi:hypothetical protein M5K25_019995 [Dendrobium thyrsiflorum]|uniref:DUF659 domain-containing protein n=1 Tax=Dendrobium thyrsiflorum TaxID=117978 RepID=A0ABD0U8S1_DENTH
MEALTNTSLPSSPAFSIPVLNHCVGGQSWWTRSRSRSCGGDAPNLVVRPRCRPKASGNHQSANRSFLFPSPPSSILSKGSNATDLAAATCSWTAAACKYNGRRCSRILTASSSSSSPKPLGEDPEEEEGKNGEEVERALGMDGSIPSSSEEFLRRVSSPAYDMRRHLFQTINSSSYEVLDHNPWREGSKPVFVLTQGNNQLCTMKTRQSRRKRNNNKCWLLISCSEVERELGLLFTRRTKWDKKVDNKVKHARTGTKFNMLVEDIREGVLVTSNPIEGTSSNYRRRLRGLLSTRSKLTRELQTAGEEEKQTLGLWLQQDKAQNIIAVARERACESRTMPGRGNWNQFATFHEKMDGRFVALEDFMKKVLEDKQEPATLESKEITGGHGMGGISNPFQGKILQVIENLGNMVRGKEKTNTSLRLDPSWKYSVQVDVGEVVKGGVTRMKEHLSGSHKNVAPCANVPDKVKEEITAYMKKSTTAKYLQHEQFDDWVEYGSYYESESGKGASSTIYSRGARGPMDQYMINPEEDREVAQMMPAAGTREGRRQDELQNTEQSINEIKRTWIDTGVTIMSDGWSDMKSRSLINILVNNPYETVFLRSIEASDEIKNVDFIFNLLDGVVEEIGKQLVVQVVTDNASAYKAAGHLLMEKRKHLYWTPCAAHCIDLILEQLGDLPQHKNALSKSKKITEFIYNPQFQYSERKSSNPEVKLGLYHCMERLIPDQTVREIADLQLLNGGSNLVIPPLSYRVLQLEFWASLILPLGVSETGARIVKCKQREEIDCQHSEWFIDDETDLPLSDLQLEDLSVDVLRGEADQAGTSTSITPHTSTSSAAQQTNKGKRKVGIIEDDEDLTFIDTIGEEDSLEDPFSDGT